MTRRSGNGFTGFAFGLGAGFRKREELGATQEVFAYPTGWWEPLATPGALDKSGGMDLKS